MNHQPGITYPAQTSSILITNRYERGTHRMVSFGGLNRNVRGFISVTHFGLRDVNFKRTTPGQPFCQLDRKA